MSEPSRHVCFKALCAGDKDAVHTTCNFLKQDGFVFLDFSNDAQFHCLALRSFESAAQYLRARRGQGPRTALHGHVSGKYKDSLRLLSGNQFRTNPSISLTDEVAINMADAVECLMKLMDEAATRVTEALAKPLFRLKDAQEVGNRYDLPLLQSKPRKLRSYGLLDIVCYHPQDRRVDGRDVGNSKESSQAYNGQTPDVVVSAHQDPGLLVLALPEMAPGLELHSSSNIWIAPPKGMGVLWAGRAASDVLMPCRHRVRLPKAANTSPSSPAVTTNTKTTANDRVACWHEICTGKQIAAPMLQYLEETDQEMTLGDSVVGTSAVLDYLRRAEDHEMSPLRVPKHVTEPERTVASLAGQKSENENSRDRLLQVPSMGMSLNKSGAAVDPMPLLPLTITKKEKSSNVSKDTSNAHALVGLSKDFSTLGFGMPVSKQGEFLRLQPAQGRKRSKTAAKKRRVTDKKKMLGKVDPPGVEPVRDHVVSVGLPIGKTIVLTGSSWFDDV